MSFNTLIQILERFAEGGWTTVWDSEQEVPHAYKGDQWIGYDDPQAIARKVGVYKNSGNLHLMTLSSIQVNYSVANGLGGVLVWSIETDDFKGVNGNTYPLLAAIKSTYVSINSTSNYR